MNDMSMLEKILSKFLTREQIVAFTEEIAKGVTFLNNIIDKNEKNKARKEFVVATFKSMDEMIEKSSKLPASVKMLYTMAKTKTHALIEPLLAKLVTENDFSDLDDIPDVNPVSSAQKAEIREHQTNANPQQNGEQGGGRRRRRRHGRNRNNNQYQNQNQEQKPETVETLHETSLPKQPEPKVVKEEKTEKPTEKTAEKPARRGRTAKKPAETTAPKPKPVETFPETSPETPQHNEPAPKKRQPRRKPKQNAE